MNAVERIFALKISLIMSVRMLGLFMLFPVMSVYASDYENSTPFPSNNMIFATNFMVFGLGVISAYIETGVMISYF